jgi:hypothetical protein
MRKIVFLIITTLILVSFTKQENHTLSGKVVDGITGERLQGAVVVLTNKASSTILSQVTDAEGNYGFNVPAGTYKLEVTKNEYTDDKPFVYETIIIKVDEQIQRDVALEKPPRFLRIMDVNHTKDIESLGRNDFSGNYYSVDFVNWGGVNIDYVTGKMCEWITEVSPSSGILKPLGSPQSSIRITIKIDPDKFEAGQTTGKVIIITNNGNKVLNIKAIGEFPEIITLPPTPILFPQKFQCQINFNGRHTFKEMGYCFSDVNPIPSINDNVVLALAYNLSTFEYDDNLTFAVTDKHQFPWLEGSELFDTRFACRTYYIRAFLKYENENDTVIYSKNIEKFTLMEFLCP